MSGRWNWPARFWSKVEKTDGCWRWRGAKQNCGYGHIWLDGKMRLAHRAAYEEVNGPIPTGMTIDHLCGERDCVNPSHMEVVTFAVNVLRGQNPPAINARKVACPKGHAYNVVQTGVRAGERYCRTCRKERSKTVPNLTGLSA